MAEETQNENAEREGAPTEEGGRSSQTKLALGVAALAAASGAGAAAIARQRSGSSGSTRAASKNGKREDTSGRVSAVVDASRGAMFDAVLPAAEHAAEAAGRFLANSGPEVLRERIVPRFVAGFTGKADSR